MPAETLDSTIHNHLVSRQRRSIADASPLRPEELSQVQDDALRRVERYLDFLKGLGEPGLRQAVDTHRTNILKGVRSGIAESTRQTTRAGEPPRVTRGMDLAKAALGLRPSFLVMNNEICLDGSLADPAGWDIALNRPEMREALRPRLAGVGLIIDEGTTALGTGFMVAPNVVMTNRHVVERMFDLDSADSPPRFLVEDARWLIHFSREAGITSTATKSIRARITELCFVTPEKIAVPAPDKACQFSQVDLALLRIEPLKGAELPVLITDWTTPLMTRPTILVVGHPYENNDYRAKYDEEHADTSISFDEVFGKQWQCKHASPGYCMPYFLPAPEREADSGRFLPECGYIHDASTLGGNSGSPVLTLEGDHRAVGLHYWGQAATWSEQVANLAHVLGAVLDAPNLSTLRAHGSTLREVLAAFQVPGVGTAKSPIAPPPLHGEGGPFDQSGREAVARESDRIRSEASPGHSHQASDRRGTSPRASPSH